jgi:hypothetical protein
VQNREISHSIRRCSIFIEKKAKDAELATIKINKLYAVFFGKEFLNKIIYVMEGKCTDTEYYDASMLLQLQWKFTQCSLTWNGQKYGNEIKALALYGFVHFVLPIKGRPLLLSQTTDPTIKKELFSKFASLSNNPANTDDVRGAYLLLTMYSVLNLDMPFKSRMDKIRDFSSTIFRLNKTKGLRKNCCISYPC